MKKCSCDCTAICDFCRLFNFNRNEYGSYTGDGYCVFHEVNKDPADSCDDFICGRYKRVDTEISVEMTKEQWEQFRADEMERIKSENRK